MIFNNRIHKRMQDKIKYKVFNIKLFLRIKIYFYQNNVIENNSKRIQIRYIKQDLITFFNLI